MANFKPEASSWSPLSLDLRPQHPARSNAANEEAVLRKACAADVRQPNESHEAPPPRFPAATACDRAESVPQNRDDRISPVLLQLRLEWRHCERHRSPPRRPVVRRQREQARAALFTSSGYGGREASAATADMTNTTRANAVKRMMIGLTSTETLCRSGGEVGGTFARHWPRRASSITDSVCGRRGRRGCRRRERTSRRARRS